MTRLLTANRQSGTGAAASARALAVLAILLLPALAGAAYHRCGVAPEPRAGLPDLQESPPPEPPPAVSLGVMPFRGAQPDQPAWIGEALRYILTAKLKKVGGRRLRIVSPEMIDRTRRGTGLDDIAAARGLGMTKFVSGHWWIAAERIHVVTWIVDVATGEQEYSETVEGDREDPTAVEKDLVPRLLVGLAIAPPAAELQQALKEDTNTSVSALGLLLESEGVSAAAPAPSPAPSIAPTTPPHSRRPPIHRWLARGWLSAPALAQQPPAPDAEIRAFLDSYRKALEDKDLAALERLYSAFPARQREAMTKYFANAADLKVEIADVSVETRGADVFVSYTRRDRFTDKRNGETQRLEVPLSKKLVREDGRWRFAE